MATVTASGFAVTTFRIAGAIRMAHGGLATVTDAEERTWRIDRPCC
jgi:hypothetical protein